MKKFIISACMLISLNAYAQVPKEENRLNELSKMGKISLAETYISLVEGLIITMPNYPFVNSEENVPDSKHIRKKWRRINKSSYIHNVILHENYRYLLPYSDKNDLIKAIMYLEEINRVINKKNE